MGTEAIIEEFYALGDDLPRFKVIGTDPRPDVRDHPDAWLMGAAKEDRIKVAMALEDWTTLERNIDARDQEIEVEALAKCEGRMGLKKGSGATIHDQIILETPRDRSNTKCMVGMISIVLKACKTKNCGASELRAEFFNREIMNCGAWLQYAKNNGKSRKDKGFLSFTCKILKKFVDAWREPSKPGQKNIISRVPLNRTRTSSSGERSSRRQSVVDSPRTCDQAMRRYLEKIKSISSTK